MWKKKVISLLMSVILVIGCVFASELDVKAITRSEVTSQLNSLIGQYNGKTANSNQMYMGKQCKGFANWVFLKIFGVYIGPYPESANYKITNPNAQTIGILEPGQLNLNSARELLKKGVPGDYIQVQRSTARGRGPHSMILAGVNDNGIEVFDCNSDGRNTIKKYGISWSSFDTANRAMSLYRAHGYDPTPNTNPPTNPQIWKNQYWYDLKDRIEVTAHADGASSYWMSMFKDGNKIISQGVEGGKFTLDASAYGEGKYQVYFSCTNSAGTVDTQWIDFDVVGSAGYSNVSVSNWWYDLKDTVSIHVDTIIAKGQRIEIDRVTPDNKFIERVIQENCDSTFNIEASRLGKGNYAAYFYVYNGSGGIYTDTVFFEIVDIPKPDAVVSASKSSYSLQDEVEISVLVYCSKTQWIGIDRNGVERVVTDSADNAKYRIKASTLGRGKYSAYFTVANNSGQYDTSRVAFAIDNELTNPQISIGKKKYKAEEDIEIKASADGGVEKYTAKIYNSKGKEILSQDFTGHDFSVNASKLGKGTFTVKVICSNYAFQKETKSLAFEIMCDHAYVSRVTKKPACKKEGVKTYQCSVCGNQYTESIEALGHTYVQAGVQEAACTSEGFRLFKCMRCEDSYKEKIAAAGHAYENKVIPPSYTEKGDTLHSCKKCGDSYKDQFTNPLEQPVKRPKATVIKSLKKYKKALTVSWKKVKDAQGYQIQYATSNTFKKAKSVTVKGAQITSRKIIGLKAKKRYYVRVRAYAGNGSDRKYSKWSKVKSQKTK